MTQLCWINSRPPDSLSVHISMPSITHVGTHLYPLIFHPHHHLPCFLWHPNQPLHQIPTVPLRRISLWGSSRSVSPLMNYPSSGTCRKKTSKAAILFSGGIGGVLNFRTFSVLPVIFSPSQVLFVTFHCVYSLTSDLLFRICCCCRAHLFGRSRHYLPLSCKP